MLSWSPGDSITHTRMTAPVETVRMASLPQSYLSWVRSHSKHDSFLHQCVNAGVPLRTGTILVRSVVDMLTACNAVPYSPNLRALAMAATMLPPTDESGGSAEFSDRGGVYYPVQIHWIMTRHIQALLSQTAALLNSVWLFISRWQTY